MDIREALYTTRAMRRVKPDPVPMDIQERIMDAAVRAPSGGNTQNWRFMLVDDKEVIAEIGPIYRTAMGLLWQTLYAERVAAAADDPDAEESKAFTRVYNSAQWLADNFETVPLFLFGFTHGKPLAECARLGGIAAAEVISHVGARPEQALKGLIRALTLRRRDGGSRLRPTAIRASSSSCFSAFRPGCPSCWSFPRCRPGCASTASAAPPSASSAGSASPTPSSSSGRRSSIACHCRC